VASVARALTVLDVLAAAPDGLGPSEVARRIGVNASSASRLLATLERGEVVERDPGGRYRLGVHLIALADGVLSRLDVRELARPLLHRLTTETGESATLSVPAGHEAVTVDFVPADASVVSIARLGRPSIAHATAVGKVMLAFGGSGSSSFEGLQLTRYTSATIVEAAALATEVEVIRARGWGEAIGERDPDLGGLAAPVLDRTGVLVAIVGVQGPAVRLAPDRRSGMVEPLLQAAADLSRSLGSGPR
jgi:DNA-binding IclR family transcriptional regulator